MQRLRDIFPKNPLYFVTCCTARRRSILLALEANRILTDAFRSAPQHHGWHIGRYVVMPDHVHFFARPQPCAKSLNDFMRDWKKWTAHEALKFALIRDALWQPEFFDHILRSAVSYSEKWEYVRQNPVRAGLVPTPEEWRWAGECDVLTF